MPRFALPHATRWAGIGAAMATLAVIALPATSYASTPNPPTIDLGTGTNSMPASIPGNTSSIQGADNDQGQLTITPSKSQPGYYKATWTDPALMPPDSLYLVGLQGTQADNPTAPIAVIAGGTVTSNGLGIVYFPEKYGGTKANPVTFEMHTTADLESLPFSQLPEVPWAAALPLVGAIPIAWRLKRGSRQV